MSENWRDWPVVSYTDSGMLEHLADRFQYFDDDVLVSSYYKSGTTLTQEIVYSLLYGVEAAKNSHLWIRSPFLEWGLADPSIGNPMDRACRLQRPRVLKSHLPAAFHMRHLQSANSAPKVIVAMRNPKDTMVSAYHHFTNCSLHANDVPKNFADFWRSLAIDGRTGDSVAFHNYFDVTLSWWSQQNHPRVCIVFYEDMLAHKADVVRRIAQFLGVNATNEQIQAVVEFTSFESMRNNPRVNPTLNKSPYCAWTTGYDFVRKGQFGDWKNYFTVADNELMDRLIEERLEPAELEFVYE